MSERANELKKIHPEAERNYILPKLRELEAEITMLRSDIKKQLREASDIDDGWFVQEAIKVFQVTQLLEIEDEYSRLKKYLPIKEPRSGISVASIERARRYPIVQLAEELLGNVKRCGSTFRSLCPFHKEKTPSFYLYTDSNCYHCFGCQVHGDVIDLAQKLNHLSFPEAVKFLS